MADTRCAVPELQLDVDLMMLEYALYCATKAQFEVLPPEEGNSEEAKRLLSVFDTLVRLFNQNHPSHIKPPELLFNLKILEFLVLFPDRPTRDFSDDHVNALREDAFQNLRARRRWLAIRQMRNQHRKDSPSDDGVSYDVESYIYASWDSPISESIIECDHATSSLFHLLPRFMEISAEMAVLLGDPNESWMDLACEFMLQASLESLRSQVEDVGTDQGVTLPRLEECFAWGYVDYTFSDPETPQHNSDQEFLINDLFRKPSEDPHESFDEENSLWTKTRAKYLDEFQAGNDLSTGSQTQRLERLAIRYPAIEFRHKLIDFLEKVWNHVRELNGAPILVQIEEGHIKSLGIEGEDFDDFLVRVGLKKDSMGLLKLKL